MSEGGIMSLIAAPRTPEFRRLSIQDRLELDLHYSMVKTSIPAVPFCFYYGLRLKKLEDLESPFLRESVLRPVCRIFKTGPRGLFLGLGTASILAHVFFLKIMAWDPEKREQIRFLQQDRGIVPMLSLPFIPKESNWPSVNKEERSSVNKVERPSTNSVTEWPLKNDSSSAADDPEMAYTIFVLCTKIFPEQSALEGTAENKPAWEKLRREGK